MGSAGLVAPGPAKPWKDVVLEARVLESGLLAECARCRERATNAEAALAAAELEIEHYRSRLEAGPSLWGDVKRAIARVAGALQRREQQLRRRSGRQSRLRMQEKGSHEGEQMLLTTL